MESESEVSYYHRRLLSVHFGQWVHHHTEGKQLEHQALRKTNTFIVQKYACGDVLADKESEILSMCSTFRSIRRLQLYCAVHLRHRGQLLLAETMRKRLLKARGWRRFQQFLTRKRTDRYHNKTIINSREVEQRVMSYFREKTRKEMRRFFFIISKTLSTKSNQRLILLKKYSSLAVAGMNRWIICLRSSAHLEKSMAKAKLHVRRFCSKVVFDKLRRRVQQRKTFQQLYALCDEQKQHMSSLLAWRHWRTQHEELHGHASRMASRIANVLAYRRRLHLRQSWMRWQGRVSDITFSEGLQRKMDMSFKRRIYRRALARLHAHAQYRIQRKLYLTNIKQQAEPLQRFFTRTRVLRQWSDFSTRSLLQHHSVSGAHKQYLQYSFKRHFTRHLQQHYLPVVVRRQAAYHRRACFHHYLYSLQKSLQRWRYRAHEQHRQWLHDVILSVHHWRQRRWRLTLSSWHAYAQERVSRRANRRHQCVDTAAFRRCRLLQRIFATWVREAQTAAQERRLRLRQQWHLRGGQHPPTLPTLTQQPANSPSLTAKIMPSSLPSKHQLLREQVRGVLSNTPSPQTPVTEAVNLLYATPKSLPSHSQPDRCDISVDSKESQRYPQYLLPEKIRHCVFFAAHSEEASRDRLQKPVAFSSNSSINSRTSLLESANQREGNETQEEYLWKEYQSIAPLPLPSAVAAAISTAMQPLPSSPLSIVSIEDIHGADRRTSAPVFTSYSKSTPANGTGSSQRQLAQYQQHNQPQVDHHLEHVEADQILAKATPRTISLTFPSFTPEMVRSVAATPSVISPLRPHQPAVQSSEYKLGGDGPSTEDLVYLEHLLTQLQRKSHAPSSASSVSSDRSKGAGESVGVIQQMQSEVEANVCMERAERVAVLSALRDMLLAQRDRLS